MLRTLGLVTSLLIIGLFIVGCEPSSTSNQPSQSRGSSRSSTSSSSAVQSMTALQQMELAFVGNPRQSVIKPKLDRAFRLYGVEITEENYSRAGSSLVVLRQETGVPEMEILEFMICSHVPGINVDFPSMAALSATAIRVGDSCR